MKQPARIESGKDTILGADDVTGLVEILEAVRHLQEGEDSLSGYRSDLPHCRGVVY